MSNEVFWSTPPGDIDKIPQNKFSDSNLWVPLSGLEEHKKGAYQCCGEFVKHWAVIYCNKLGRDNFAWVLFTGKEFMYGTKKWKRKEITEVNTLDELREYIRCYMLQTRKSSRNENDLT